MKRKVTIELWIDPTEYNQVPDTDKGAISVAHGLLKGDTDIGSKHNLVRIKCGKSRMPYRIIHTA